MISVCMATYNGSRHVLEQIDSILVQLRLGDEIVIVDDASTDSTVALVRSLGDERIRIYEQTVNAGHVAAFETALERARGDVIILSDQDDVWLPGRVADAEQKLRNDTGIVASNFTHMGGVGGEPSPLRSTTRGGAQLSDLMGLFLGRRAYFGSTMAITTRFRDQLLPFPRGTEAHDHWMAILGIIGRSMRHSDQVAVLRRIHGSNLTPTTRRGWTKVLMTRVTMGRLTLIAATRVARTALEARR